MKGLFLAVFVLVSCNAWAVAGGTVKKGGAVFARSVQFADQAFGLKGLAVQYFLFMKVFVAGFYADPSAGGGNFLDDVPKKIEVAYFYHIPAGSLCSRTRQLMRANLGDEKYAALGQRLDLMDKYFCDLKPGDRYSLLYIPGVGTHFLYNGKLRGIIEGADFAKGIFAVWIGKNPLSPDIKSHLLGAK